MLKRPHSIDYKFTQQQGLIQKFILDQDINFYLIHLNILITCWLDSAWIF